MPCHDVAHLTTKLVMAIISEAHQVVFIFKHYSDFALALPVDFFTQSFHLPAPFFHAMFRLVILLYVWRLISAVGAVVKRHVGSWPVIFLYRCHALPCCFSGALWILA